jgi:hypothetical protein
MQMTAVVFVAVAVAADVATLVRHDLVGMCVLPLLTFVLFVDDDPAAAAVVVVDYYRYRPILFVAKMIPNIHRLDVVVVGVHDVESFAYCGCLYSYYWNDPWRHVHRSRKRHCLQMAVVHVVDIAVSDDDNGDDAVVVENPYWDLPWRMAN